MYCEVMSDWVDAVRSGGALEDVYPVPVSPTEYNAAKLSKRIDFLRDKILPEIR